MTYAGIWRRLGAYLVDIVPIVVLVAAASIIFLGFDFSSAGGRSSDSERFERRVGFFEQRNQIRDGSFVLWLFYSAVLEASTLQGTLGKRLLGVKVVDESGDRLSLGRSAGRNVAKVVSALPLGLGFIWALFRKDRRTWHDLIAGTHVIRLQPWDRGLS